MILALLNVFVLVGLLRFLIESEQPWLCAGAYTLYRLVIGLAWGGDLLPTLLATAIVGVVASLYFWLLDRFAGSGVLWWSVFVIGLIPMVSL